MSNFRCEPRSSSIGLWLTTSLVLSLGCSSSSKGDETGVGGTLSQGGRASAGQAAVTSANRGGNSGLSATGGQAASTASGGHLATSNGAGGGSVGLGGTYLGGASSGGAATVGQPNAGSTSSGTARGGTTATSPSGGRTNGGTAAAGRASGGTAATTSGATPIAGRNSGGAALGGQSSSNSTGGQGVAGGTAAVRIVGRTGPGTKGGVRFQWSGVSIQARFRGTQVSIQLDDGGNQNEFAVVIDGKSMTNLVTASGKTSYQLATGLSDFEHDLIVWRRTEAYYNPTEYLGLSDFGTNGALLPPAAPPEHRIEIIGDSITCGYGNEGVSGCSGTKPENNYLAYGSVAARTLGADLHTVAWSGIGMYRNYGESGPSTDTMPTRYDTALPTVSGSSWDFTKFVPEVVVINLGTNDFSTKGDPGQPYVDAYVKFVQHVRSVYPQAYLFCLIPVTEATTALNNVVTTIKNAGDSKIEAFDTNVSTGGFGCDGHPDVAKHAAMGAKLAAEIQRVMSW